MIFDELKKPEDFDALQLKLASPEEILSWSYGEVTKPETINYRTQRAEKDGLFSEAIFGPEKDWECYCGKYRRIRYKGVICDRCGVEVTRSIVRRERMGHIKLAVPVSHIWFLRGVPSRIGLILNISVQKLEKVIYFAAYIVTKVDETARQKVFKEIEKEYKTKLKTIRGREARKELKLARDCARDELSKIKKMEIISELTFQQLSQKYSEVFSAGIGAEAIREILKEIDLDKLINELGEELKRIPPGQKKKILARLRLLNGLKRAGIRPEWMFLTILPIMPPDLRPMVQLDGGRFATSDVNDLYRRVINRNNRLKRLLELNAPEVICRNEKRMLQEAVDALIDNAARRGQKAVMATTGQRRQLKSLADMLRGKQGRFRQNLLGKRVDYSGRSVIVVGPELKLYQCGIPKIMALELFKPFVINKLIERELVYNIRGARRLIEEGVNEVWAILEEVIERYHVLLNRAPTLHRLGVQAFRPVLIEGLAIQIHPMVCKAFNADFDGDQMAVHLPLSENAQRESREIMASVVNLFKPATGEAIVYPTEDMILGCYFMTKIQEGLKGEGKVFGDGDEAIFAYQSGIIDLQAKIKIPARDKEKTLIETSTGRIIFNSILPEGMEFTNKELNAKQLKSVTEEAIGLLGTEKAQEFLDKIKNLGFEYATKSGISWGMDDLTTPAEKYQIIEKAQKEIDEVRKQYQEGLLTRVERKTKSIEIWASIKNKISDLVPKALDPHGPVNMIFSSGARGSWSIATQLVGMRGLVINPASEVIELPVISSLKEGFNVLEYFISTHGGRKGLADTALKTASAGYLTRRLVDVAQDVVISEDDCKDREGIMIYKRDLEDLGISLVERITGRVSLQEVKNPKSRKVILKRNELINKVKARELEALGIDKLLVRSPITCKTRFGICRMCYGYDLGRNKLINLGEAVGIVSAQAIGEPGTQLTLRTFHTGGVAGGADITQGLPRVEEIFEARVPRGKAAVSELTGKIVSIKEKGGQKVIKIQGWIEDKKKRRKKAIKEYVISPQTGIWVQKGDSVTRGQQICEGPVDLKEMFKLADKEAVQRYVIKEVQKIYSTQGGGLNDKHIEIIIHQMFSRLRVKDPGDTNLLAGAILEKDIFLQENDRIKKQGKKQATCQPLILGITKVALSTESFLSAASFQETVRILIKAATEGKLDSLRGLKENVIIGKLIPAGTGFRERMERKEKE
ncbi:MAG: DNA-directed RNA polymerase subunit beta' [Candidatus Portnoybacteria bacterium CG10_big_fil_rev_8_21_14_0_10_38_18]|uniref:DNA-directed RNA polymerase subunit beta' n=1 Tax=Candidatus Portnoybacteria bacterium CG10_big_fil_rev_8_21_14_0_10_38_18 TaxID=1974813 RepID=A0A2M8KCZ9_9BACT|nr:MAG: DNA-directed RNA polymerase subunit beta' [Candidatus Portnoybacteria bacterium CG10_big_fil_rev_8_21_14_0_10_38_18]